MEVSGRASLEASHISALPKLDIQQVVLDYVKTLRSYSKVHATEGKAYVASWGKEDVQVDTNMKTRSNRRSCGFATPILKPRITKEKAENSTRNTASPKKLVPHPKNPKPAGAKTRETSQKPSATTRSIEPLTRRESRRTKRNRELQSDEEKRLQERREKKRAKREIMRPQASKNQDDDADDDTDTLQNKKSKKKQKLPAGLALMYGFSATNVGKNRLTVEPPFRSGMFSKGKASVQTQIGKSKLKSKPKSLAFSEERFLNSTRRHLHGSMRSSSSVSQSSALSSEPLADDDMPRQNPKAEKSPPIPTRRTTQSKEMPLAKEVPRKTLKPAKAQKTLSDGETSNISSEKKTQSVLWDIEKDGGVLPTEDESVLTCGLKSSTVVLDVTRKPWMRGFPTSDNDVPVAQKLLDRAIDISDRHSATRKDRCSLSAISSVRPSESPSQVIPTLETGSENREATTSKYFPSKPEPIPPGEKHSTLAAAPDPIQDWQETSAIQDDERHPSFTLELLKNVEHPIVTTINAKEYVQDLRDTAGSDWLLSDPVLNNVPYGIGGDGGAEFSIFEDSSPGIRGATLQDETLIRYEEALCLSGESDAGEFYENTFLPKETWVEGVTRGGSVLTTFDDEIYTPQLGIYEHMDAENTFIEDLTEDRPVLHLEDDSDELFSLDSSCLSSLRSEEQMPHPQSPFRRSMALTTSLLHFNEGRLLLDSVIEPSSRYINFGLESIEADVAQRLVGHWLPQKF